VWLEQDLGLVAQATTSKLGLLQVCVCGGGDSLLRSRGSVRAVRRVDPLHFQADP
jgi:hypothetical protein